LVHCNRRIISNSINEISIIDEGELNAKGKLVFHLQSTFPFKTESIGVTIAADNFGLVIKAPWACEVLHRAESINFRHQTVYHLILTTTRCKNFSLNTALVIRKAEYCIFRQLHLGDKLVRLEPQLLRERVLVRIAELSRRFGN
jgi:hypothetical protein